MSLKKGEDKVRRVGSDFLKEIDSIKSEVKKATDKRVSNQEITNAIPKHNFWGQLKKELIEFMIRDKKGIETLNLFLMILLGFAVIIILGVYALIFNTINDNLDQETILGQVNMSEITRDTFGQINSGFLAQVDLIGILILFGMILLMFANAYFTRGKYPKLMIIIDIVLIIFAYIVSLYVANTYYTLINAADMLSIYTTSLPDSSRFILYLPYIVSIVGVIIMILSYSGLPRERSEDVVVGY